MSERTRSAFREKAVLPFFDRLASATALQAGRPLAFAIALGVVILWALLGPREHYSDTWQLVINTGTTVVTFLMVFLIQHSQNRDAAAVRLKLDELIRAMKSADNRLLAAEDMSEMELQQLHLAYENLARTAKERLDKRSARERAATASTQMPESRSPDNPMEQAHARTHTSESLSRDSNGSRQTRRGNNKRKDAQKPMSVRRK